MGIQFKSHNLCSCNQKNQSTNIIAILLNICGVIDFLWQQLCAASRAGMWHPNVYPNLHFIVRLSVISWILEVSTCEKFITAILPSQYKYKFIEIDICNIHTHDFKCSFKIKLENEDEARKFKRPWCSTY